MVDLSTTENYENCAQCDSTIYPGLDLESELGLRRSYGAHILSGFLTIPRARSVLLSWISKLEGGVFYSYTLRHALWRRYRVYAGAYSYGAWCRPGAMPAGTVIGRYVSMAYSVKVFSRNHPSERLSMHPFFYNKSLKFVDRDTIPSRPCWIGHDAWIGDSVIITPSCNRIGIGAVVGAGAVVTKDVPDFAIVAGNPAKVVRWRFKEPTQASILASRWWERSVSELLPHIDDMQRSLDEDLWQHPVLSGLKRSDASQEER